MIRLLFTGPLVLALASGAGAVITRAAAEPAAAPHKTRANKPRTAHKHEREPGQIACTFDGCHRIPARCHPETGYTSGGLPTGYDIVVCP